MLSFVFKKKKKFSLHNCCSFYPLYFSFHERYGGIEKNVS